MSLERELSVAVRAVGKASRLCTSAQTSLLKGDVIAKEDRSPVTVADLGSQAVINIDLMQSFAGDPVVCEEDASMLEGNECFQERVVRLVTEQAGSLGVPQILEALDYGAKWNDRATRFWTVDPIDGTRGFLRGEQYAIALALVEDGQVVLGVLGCPNLPFSCTEAGAEKGCIFFAARNQGAFLRRIEQSRPRRISVDNLTLASEARFCESVEGSHSSQGAHARIASLLGMTTPPYRIDGQCKYAAVSRGDASVYLHVPSRSDCHECIWDHAAGSIIVTEAGGQVTDIRGARLDFSVGRKLSNNVGIVATNGSLHQQVLDVVAQVV